MTKNRQKNGSLNRDLLNFFYRYGIFWMPPGESSHPGGSEYVWQRGVEGVLGWVMGGRSWPFFQKKKTKMSRQKKQIRPKFSKYRFQNESALGHSQVKPRQTIAALKYASSQNRIVDESAVLSRGFWVLAKQSVFQEFVGIVSSKLCRLTLLIQNFHNFSCLLKGT